MIKQDYLKPEILVCVLHADGVLCQSPQVQEVQAASIDVWGEEEEFTW